MFHVRCKQTTDSQTRLALETPNSDVSRPWALPSQKPQERFRGDKPLHTNNREQTLCVHRCFRGGFCCQSRDKNRRSHFRILTDWQESSSRAKSGWEYATLGILKSRGISGSIIQPQAARIRNRQHRTLLDLCLPEEQVRSGCCP